MGTPWQGPRHRSWASNTALSFVMLVVLVIATVISDYFGEPPNYLVGLLGTAAGAFFAAIGTDKEKRDQDVARTATRAEATATRAERKADVLGDVASHEHPDDELPDPPFDRGGAG
ncbi:membrane protein [Mycobacterium phage Saguaro]|uniref:Membrane protein n=1 Tax=Mycobacterium phage Saguaro TaxID=2315616 RepID=A0A386K9V4_9CAUD|nr:membrane protein [Mycobacterium phage Saguaro]AYD82013.1 membrane protein [Mycobacterium phage Saguaro]